MFQSSAFRNSQKETIAAAQQSLSYIYLRCAPSSGARTTAGLIKFFQFFLRLPAYIPGNLDFNLCILVSLYRRILHGDNALSSQADLCPRLGAFFYLTHYISINRRHYRFASQHSGGKRNPHRSVNIQPFSLISRLFFNSYLKEKVSGLGSASWPV